MDPRTVAANVAAINTVRRLREDNEAALDIIVDYLGKDASSAAARLALSLAALCWEALDERPDDPDAWLAGLAFVGDIEDSMKDVGR